MADITTLARPYAKAVFELARDSGKFADWSSVLKTIADAVTAPQVAQLLGHPALTRADLAAVLAQTLGSKLGAEGSSLLKLLVENGRLTAASSIAQQYEQLRAEAEARADVEITTAVPVVDAQQQQLASAVKKRLGREVVVAWGVDESLIAGAVIRAGDLVIDGSVKSELERLETALAR
ncbi:F0F1 ATP synthase subunit delta [Solimonas sp. K1W22B-7]|uniref:F0F1 ATP synthase subunit delta n=1 Tax=Solimonas sp. K1W22B-7 TaxID=2303331 RepID=UPI000E335794|nr:F0F1 ATP synthase subunit delta [Solimonas sp. K1W22B-7]AXQ27634.1 F0F1 ATP synthase subunit delta [Solimonas sp. K1W22B-7]